MKISKDYQDFRKSVRERIEALYNLRQENISWVKRVVLSKQPIVFYNKCKMFFDESSLPPSCSDVTDLSNKYVLYGIYCNNKFYIGSTGDFGERMTTHIRDSRKDKGLQRLYTDMAKTGECVSFVFGVLDNEKNLKDAEHTVIKECKDYSVKRDCKFDDRKVKFVSESLSDMKKCGQKYCYNIKN